MANYDPRSEGQDCWQVMVYFPPTPEYRYGKHLTVIAFRKTLEEAIASTAALYPGARIENVSKIGARAVIA